eukprot:6603838-Pyramimonas_sp.AAC.1
MGITAMWGGDGGSGQGTVRSSEDAQGGQVGGSLVSSEDAQGSLSANYRPRIEVYGTAHKGGMRFSE